MKISQEESNKKRLQHIQESIIDLASGDLTVRTKISNKRDDIEAIAVGINLLAEELEQSTVSSNFFNSILESMVDMVCVVDHNLKLQRFNQSTIVMLNQSRGQLKNVSFNNFLRWESSEFEKLLFTLKTNNSITNLETFIFNAEGSEIPISINITKLVDNFNKESGFILVGKNITNLKKVEDELIKSNNELNTFIYKLSHDIRGPLSSILGLSDIALEDAQQLESTKGGELVEFLELISESAVKLDNIMYSLNNVLQLRSRKPDKSLFNIENLCAEICSKMLPKGTNFNYEINCTSDFNINSDQNMVKLALSQIVLNTYEHRRRSIPNPYCQIDITKLKDNVMIKVKDNGKGISKSHLSKIFEMFHKASAHAKGSGLGLFLTKAIIDKLGGEIQVFSKVQEGSEFILLIPRK